MTDISQNASAFNCGLVAFEKFDVGRMSPAWFTLQLQDHSR